MSYVGVDDPETILGEVESALGSVTSPDPRDAGARALALHYARLMSDPSDDEHATAMELGPKLLAALEALLLTPRSRAAGPKEVTPNVSKLDQLAERRRAKSS